MSKRWASNALTALCCLAFSGLVAQQNLHLVSSEYLGYRPKGAIAFYSPLPAEFNVEFYKITYRSVDINGDSTLTTGALAIPVSETCNSFPVTAYCHRPVLMNYNIPSEENDESGMLVALASSGFITVAPDYLGLGDNPGMHPYLHAQSEATATVDAIRAAYEFLPSQDMYSNGELFVTGYSQGGHAAMATLKYIQDNELSEELPVTAGAPMSGPYNLSRTQTQVLLDDAVYSSPGYVLYSFYSYQMIYGNLYNEISDIVQEPYATDTAPYFDGDQDEYSLDFVNSSLPSLLSEFLVDTFVTNITDLENNINHPYRLDLVENDNFDWTPQVPIRMYYCDGDLQVTPVNALSADSAMNANGADDVAAINVLEGGDHFTCINPALIAAHDFFQSLSEGCSFFTEIGEASEDLNVRFFPNPASGRTTVTTAQPGVLLLYAIDGRLVSQHALKTGNTPIDLSELAAGTYVASIRCDNRNYRKTLVVN